MQTITTCNTPKADKTSNLSSEFSLKSDNFLLSVASNDTQKLRETLLGVRSGFNKLVASFIYPEQCQDAIAVIQESELGGKEKESRVNLLMEQSREVTVYIQKTATFEPTTKEYNGFSLERTARYDDEQRGFIITASHPEYGSKTFAAQDFKWGVIEKDAKKWVDRVLSVTAQELHQEDAETTLSIDDEAKIKLSQFVVGQEVWVKNRKGELRGVNQAMAHILFADTNQIDQVHGIEVALAPERDLRTEESDILEFIKSSESPVSDRQISEALDMSGIPAARGFLKNLVGFGLITSFVDEEGDNYYSVKSAATQVCEEMEQIASHIRVEHESVEVEEVNDIPFTDEYEEAAIEFSDGEVLLTKEQAELIVEEINHSTGVLVQTANRLRDCIKTLDVGKGYEALGYKDMSELFRSGLLEKSRSTLQKEWQAHRVEQALGMDTGTLVLEHGLKLFPVLKKAPEKLEEVYHAAFEEAEISESNLNARCIQSAIAEVAPELKPKPKSKSKLVGNRGKTQAFRVVLPGVQIEVSDIDTMTELSRMEQPENLLVPAMLEMIMELDPTITSRQEAIARLVEKINS